MSLSGQKLESIKIANIEIYGNKNPYEVFVWSKSCR